MDFRRLQYFIAVAEERHYGRAAERLHVAQPAVSQQIARLEREMNFELFERGHHSVRLTEAGRILLGDARRILAMVEEATNRATAASKGLLGGLNIGFVGSMHFSLPVAIATIQKHYPDVRIRLAEMSLDHLLAALYEERIDLGLFRQWPLRLAMTVEEIGTTALAVALPRGHRLLKLKAVPLVELAAEPFIYFSRTVIPWYAERINARFAEAGVVPRVAQEVFTSQVALSFVAAGKGISVMPEPLPSVAVPGEGVQFRPLIEPQIIVPTVAAWTQKNQSPDRSVIVKALRDASKRR
jgi:DNA-binding transcriptional LysR family regulator